MKSPLKTFERNRRLAIFGMAIGLLVGMAIVFNAKFSFLSQRVVVPIGGGLIALSFFLVSRYRCPYCSGDPEREEDVVHFGAERCQSCGKALRAAANDSRGTSVDGPAD